MKIYSMTATFGKLEHQTLTLKSGLNVSKPPTNGVRAHGVHSW